MDYSGCVQAAFWQTFGFLGGCFMFVLSAASALYAYSKWLKEKDVTYSAICFCASSFASGMLFATTSAAKFFLDAACSLG